MNLELAELLHERDDLMPHVLVVHAEYSAEIKTLFLLAVNL